MVRTQDIWIPIKNVFFYSFHPLCINFFNTTKYDICYQVGFDDDDDDDDDGGGGYDDNEDDDNDDDNDNFVRK